MKHNHGASGRGPNAGAANLAMLKRTVKKLFSYYPVLAPITFACILFSSIVSSIPSLFTQNVIQVIEKWYVSRDWAAAQAELKPILTLLVVLYALSILAILVQVKSIQNRMSQLIHLRIALSVLQFLDDNNALLIYSSDKISALSTKKALHALH